MLYELASTADSELRQDCCLLQHDQYQLLNRERAPPYGAARREFDELCAALTVVGIVSRDQRQLWRILSAVS